MTDLDQSYHYNVIRRAIAVIYAHGDALSLTDLASEMRMSPAHFQRLFLQWVGVSPKRDQQYLALGHAKALLAQRFTTLQAAEAAGLSGAAMVLRQRPDRTAAMIRFCVCDAAPASFVLPAFVSKPPGLAAPCITVCKGLAPGRCTRSI